MASLTGRGRGAELDYLDARPWAQMIAQLPWVDSRNPFAVPPKPLERMLDVETMALKRAQHVILFRRIERRCSTRAHLRQGVARMGVASALTNAQCVMRLAQCPSTRILCKMRCYQARTDSKATRSSGARPDRSTVGQTPSARIGVRCLCGKGEDTPFRAVDDTTDPAAKALRAGAAGSTTSLG